MPSPFPHACSCWTYAVHKVLYAHDAHFPPATPAETPRNADGTAKRTQTRWLTGRAPSAQLLLHALASGQSGHALYSHFRPFMTTGAGRGGLISLLEIRLSAIQASIASGNINHGFCQLVLPNKKSGPREAARDGTGRARWAWRLYASENVFVTLGREFAGAFPPIPNMAHELNAHSSFQQTGNFSAETSSTEKIG